MKMILITLFLLINFFIVVGQATAHFADSIRTYYNIPELAFAAASADSIFEMQVLGVQRIHTKFNAKPDDRFHIGSNTKAITSFISALLVEQGFIKWNTKFLDLFPELRQDARQEYQNITLQDLLTFRGKLPAYTYTFDKPKKEQITGDNAHQRFLLAKYFLSQRPMQVEDGLTPSNADYVLAGLMIERATGKNFKELVTGFGKTQGIDVGFDYPNLSDTSQPWGHDVHLTPLPPDENYKLNWLLSAGNINVNLPDYLKFMQLQLKGIKGQTKILSPKMFNDLLYGLPAFAFGWFNKVDPVTNYHIAYNEGNAGAFITQVQVVKETGTALVVFTNSASAETNKGVTILMDYLQKKYGR